MVVSDIIVDVVGDALTMGCAAEMVKFMNIVSMYHVIKQQHQIQMLQVPNTSNFFKLNNKMNLNSPT